MLEPVLPFAQGLYRVEGKRFVWVMQRGMSVGVVWARCSHQMALFRLESLCSRSEVAENEIRVWIEYPHTLTFRNPQKVPAPENDTDYLYFRRNMDSNRDNIDDETLPSSPSG